MAWAHAMSFHGFAGMRIKNFLLLRIQFGIKSFDSIHA
jgi:hypothetical protein